MRINFLKHGASVLVLVLFGFLALGSGTAEKAVKKETTYKEIPLSELGQAISNVDGPGQGFIVQAELPSSIDFSGYTSLGDGLIRTELDQNEYAELGRRIEQGKVYTIYIAISGNGEPILERIDGLMTLEELANRDAQRKAEQEAARETERLAQEEK
ncbi:hypothetical protein FACS189485_16060 [Spirochaetia bacterium]|nr:hypothetical protein FACS189485_16060 [Spirochaetia bacterium]